LENPSNMFLENPSNIFLEKSSNMYKYICGERDTERERERGGRDELAVENPSRAP